MADYKLTTDVPWVSSLGELRGIFAKWGVAEYQIYGKPHPGSRYYGGQKWDQTEEERTVTVWFRHPSGREINLTLSDQRRSVDNLRALVLTLDDLRMLEKRGALDLVREALLQLPSAANPNDPWQVLGVPHGASLDVLKSRWRELARRWHPDVGGDAEEFKRLAAAYQAALAEAESSP